MYDQVTLKEITTKIGSGSTPKGGKESYQKNGTTLIRSLNVYDFAFEYKNLAFINEEQSKKLEGVKVIEDDILLNITGASVGRCTIVPTGLLPARVNQHVSIIRINKDKAHPKFILYCINSDIYKKRLLAISDDGATREALTKDDIEKFQLLLPALTIQKRIASILSAYDDLIEVNNQRIKLLEETARELYKEWFVRMRFPGYKKTRFLKGIPFNWGIKRLSELVTTQYGYTASAVSEPVGPKFLRITDIANLPLNWDEVPHCEIEESELHKYLLQEGDIVVARTGATVGYAKRLNKLHPTSIFASYLVRIKAKDSRQSLYLGLIIESDVYKEYIQTVAGGAAQPQANAGLMTNFLLLLPPEDLLQKFNAWIQPMLDQQEVLQKQNDQLRQIRDRLLPRLISGKLQLKAPKEAKVLPINPPTVSMVAETDVSYRKKRNSRT